MRASLAGAGKWIVDRGVLPRFAYESAPADLPDDQIARLCTEVDMPLGRMRYLAPIVRMSETPTRWARPPVPLGHSPAAWPA